MIPRTIALLVVSLAALLNVLLDRSASAQGVDAAMKFIPPDSHAALIIPNLKMLSDQITECLEGMDRANVLLGARPLDHFKAATGFNVGVNETGTMAIALTRLEEGSTALVFLIPVSDAEAFVRTNLTPAEDGAYATAGGMIVHMRSLGTHVALAEHAAALQGIGNQESQETLQQIVGERGVEVALRGEAFLVIRKELITGAIAYARAHSNEAAVTPNFSAVPLSMAADVEAAAISVDFDPLGLFVRSFARVKPGTRAARILGIESPATQAPFGVLLQRVPNKPFYAAAAFDFAAVADRDALAEIFSKTGLNARPSFMQNVSNVQFAAYPSPAGQAGGLLNDAVAVFTTAEPQQVKEGIKQALLGLRSDAPIRREVNWTDERRVDETLVAGAFEVKTLDAPAEFSPQQALEKFLFGSAGIRGFVTHRDDAVIITFSQRAATLKDALNAIESASEQSGLAAQSTLRSMRQWLPATAAFQIFVNPGRLAQFADAMFQAAPVNGGDVLPKFDPSLPPIAIGAGPTKGGAEHALVIPSGVLAAIFDHAQGSMPDDQFAPSTEQ